MMDLLHLIRNGIGKKLIVVPQSTGGNSTDTIQIVLAVGRFQKTPLARINGQFIATAQTIIQKNKKQDS